MKNKRVQRLTRFLSLFILTFGLCSCSDVKILNRECSVKNKSPYTIDEPVNSQDMRDIRLEYNEYGSSYSETNTNYFLYENDGAYVWLPDNEYEYFLNCTLDSEYNLNLNVQTVPVVNPTIYSVSIYSIVVPLDSTYENFPNDNLCFMCQSNTMTNCMGLINYFDDHDIYPSSLFDRYGCLSFDGIPIDAEDTRGVTNIYDLSLNTTNRKLYLLIEFDSPISITINENVSQYSTYNLGKLKMFMLDFPNNSIYQKYDSTTEQAVQDAYNNGYANGQASGIAIGRQDTIDNTYQGKTYQQIYNTGYTDGQNSTTGANVLIPSLFGAIVNIPISVLNGLVPLTFFDVSIIRVALTFLSLGVVMWIIRKVLI